MTKLSEEKCVPSEEGISPLSNEKEELYINELDGWMLSRQGIHNITKEFYFEDFNGAIKFVNKVAEIAEKEGHHPYIHIYYDTVKLELYTHAINGLHLNDFILAAKIDNLN